MKIHYLDSAALNALRLSPDKVRAKLNAGWQWHRMVPGFCAAGGTANYNRALVSPTGEIAYVSDRADGPSGAAAMSALPALEISHQLIGLTVPFAEKGDAKALGAIWIGHKRTWACAPGEEGKFSKWATEPPLIFDLMADDPGEEAVRADRPRFA